MPCPVCSKPCTDLGYKLRLPARRDAKGWAAIQQALRQRGEKDGKDTHLAAVRECHELEREIRRLDRLVPNQGRSKRIQELRIRLVEISLDAKASE